MTRLTDATLDTILSWQFTIAWAGEGQCEPKRLDWWRTDLIDEYGGGDLFQRLVPNTHRWASLEAVRQAAILHEQNIRRGMAQPDQAQSLFCWGFFIDEQLTDRLAVHKQNLQPPELYLDLPIGLDNDFSLEVVEEALQIPGQTMKVRMIPHGREVVGEIPKAYELRARNLASALLPLSEHYPMPFYRMVGDDAN